MQQFFQDLVWSHRSFFEVDELERFQEVFDPDDDAPNDEIPV